MDCGHLSEIDNWDALFGEFLSALFKSFRCGVWTAEIDLKPYRNHT
jgi:hypothetical protein